MPCCGSARWRSWHAPPGSRSLLLATLAVVVPFLLWNGIMGFVVYLHHTSPKIAWFQNRQEWQRHRAYLTVHRLRAPSPSASIA